MTIRYQLPVRELSDRFVKLERGATGAQLPVVRAVTEAASAVRTTLRALGFNAPEGDRLTELEAIIYGYLLAGNPGNPLFHGDLR